MSRNRAGPTLSAFLAPCLARHIERKCRRHGRHLGDPLLCARSQVEIDGVRHGAANDLEVVSGRLESRLSWTFVHPRWRLRTIEHRILDQEAGFSRASPYNLVLEGDLAAAARFLGLPRQLFIAALRADGWTKPEAIIEDLRWPETPYSTGLRAA